MNSSFFDVFHDARDQHIFAVTEAIDVDFNCILEETVYQHRALWSLPRRHLILHPNECSGDATR